MRPDGYEFILNGAEYYVFCLDKNRDVLFPIHDVCLDVIENVLQNRNEGIPPSVPQTFYDSLCKQYSRNSAKWPRENGYCLNGLEWDHNYYGVRKLQGYYDWEACHSDEW